MKARKKRKAKVTIDHDLTEESVTFLKELEQGRYLKEIAARMAKSDSQIKHLRHRLGVVFGARTNRELLAKARTAGVFNGKAHGAMAPD